MRTALITGASRGIGLAIACRLAAQGYGLTVTSRSAADLAAVRQKLTSLGSAEVVSVAADMADCDALSQLVERHDRAFGSVSALILNAGVGTAGRVENLDVGHVARTFDVNFTAAVILMRASLPLLRAAAEADPRHGAKIVALSSITGVYPERGLATYGASKAALCSLVDTVNREESSNGIIATAIAPGYVDTDMAAWVADRVPVASMIPVEDIANIVDMLLRLGRNSMIGRIVVARGGTSGFGA